MTPAVLTLGSTLYVLALTALLGGALVALWWKWKK